jgi:hypothetical protein
MVDSEQAALGDFKMTDAITQEIMSFGVEVIVKQPLSPDDDLGRITGCTLEVVDDPKELTIAPFTLCHLFGHLVQFTTRDRYEHLIGPVSEPPPVVLPESFWQEFHAYEREAFGYGATILERAVHPNDDMRVKYADFMETDFEHFRSFISTGRKPGRSEYRIRLQSRYELSPGTIHIAPIAIPRVEWANIQSVEVAIF